MSSYSEISAPVNRICILERVKPEGKVDKALRFADSGFNFFRRFPILALISPFLLLWLYQYVFKLFHTYDWNQSFTKLICFTALFLIVYFLTKSKKEINLPSYVYIIELVILSGIFIWLLWTWKQKYYWLLWGPPAVDIGATTQAAAHMLFNLFQNPYQSETLNVLIKDPGYAGFKYGPMMILGYFPSALFPQSGFKLANLFYLTIGFISLCYLAWQKNAGLVRNWSTMIFVLILAMIPERVGYELFFMGANDALHITLLLLSLVFVKRGNLFMAGLCAGLSFSAKFSPALFFIALFFRRDFSWRFFIGIAVGLLPNVFFLAWDHESFIRNVYLFNVLKTYDSTSLYSITPQELHYVFPAVQLFTMLYFMAKGFFKRLEVMDLATSFILVLLVIEAAFKEVHGNHLVWFVPFLALIIGRNRYQPVGMLSDFKFKDLAS